MKGKRGTDHNWQVIKYRGDMAIYARCKCGFEYCCSHDKRKEDGTWTFEQEIDYFYYYCPFCGARKNTRDAEVTKLDRFPPYMEGEEND